MIKLSQIDLDYLLAQVNIGADYSQLSGPLDPSGVREVDGANNNLVGAYDINGNYVPGANINGDWGQADTDFLRLFQTNHPDSANYPAAGTTYGAVTKVQVHDVNGVAPGGAGYIATYADAPMMNSVTDGSVRLISNLIASSVVDAGSEAYNPAAVAAMNNYGGNPIDVSNSVVGSTQAAYIPNPGILGGIPYNDWFVAFGQFFDHGLDFISKGGGYVMIPIPEGDPLYSTEPGAQNMMMLNRATLANPDSDFDAMGNLLSTATAQFNNNTGLLIDQSQTYGSSASVNALLREYDANGVMTGRLIDGTVHGAGSAHELATWADMKANALKIGVILTDADVSDVPMLKTTSTGVITYTIPATPISANDPAPTNPAEDPFVRYPMGTHDADGIDISGQVVRTNQPMLADINPAADPNFHFDFDGMAEATYTGTHFDAATNSDVAFSLDYDAALLDAHYVSGDGRVNENVGLTAVHHVFHEEHNTQVVNLQNSVLLEAAALLAGPGDAANNLTAEEVAANYINAWLGAGAGQSVEGTHSFSYTDADDNVQSITLDGVNIDAAGDLAWDGEKVFQAARIVTESEYNHIAVDQYAGTLYPALPEFVSYSTDINMSVSLEFSQAVFRLGHSMLSEHLQFATENATGKPGDPGYVPTYSQVGLFDAFLNPELYAANGASAIALGLINQQANEVDEFVTPALQQSLLGTALDLPALNLARGRDVGLPTLNELRQQAYDGLVQNTNNNANGSGLAPYKSWSDFGGHLRTPESLVNFIAAYGRDDGGPGNTEQFGLQTARDGYLAGNGTTLADVRAAAQAILDAYATGDADAVAFMDGAPFYNAATQTWEFTNGDLGFWDIDLWIGGLAEQPLFDGPLGTTFSYIMLDFTQRLQDGDRFYYLYRMPVGQHLGDQIIGEQFHDLVMRTTDLEHLNGDVFGNASETYYLDDTDVVDGGTGFKSNVDSDDDANDYFNAIGQFLHETNALTIANGNFEAPGDAIENNPSIWYLETIPYAGNYTAGNVTGWNLLPQHGGLQLFTANSSNPAGHDGATGIYMNPASIISQDTGISLTAGNSYTLNLKVGARLDGFDYLGGQARLLADDGVNPPVLLKEVDLPTPAAGEWSFVTLETNPIGLANAGQTLRIEVVSNAHPQANGYGQILLDNFSLSETVPVGSANDGHIVVAGLGGNDYIIGALGDDTIYGDDGNDIIEGAQGNDHLYGGDGDDYITDYENDDFISGGAGNDYVSAGPGVLDTIHGNDGDDELHGGDGIDEVFGDDGDDMLFGEGDTDLMIGGEGSDYVDGGDSVDEVFGGNGNDWLRGGVGDDNLNGGSGNDLIEGGLGAVANDGDRLFGDTPAGLLPVIEFNGDGTEGDMDIGSYEDVGISIFASLQSSNASGTSSNLLDTYAFLEGLVGSRFDDVLEGGSADAVGGNGPDNYLIGGAGNDRLTGLGGDDLIIGDSARVDNALYWEGDARHTTSAEVGDITNWRGTGETRIEFADGTLGHVLGDNADAQNPDGDMDVAVYRNGVANYNFSATDEGVITVTDTRDPATTIDPVTGIDTHDGTDTLVDIELVEFDGVTYNVVMGTTGSDVGAGSVDGDAGNTAAANDLILGLAGVDELNGLDLADVLVGGGGNDNIDGGAGDDIIVWNVDDGRDIIDGGTGMDTYIANGLDGIGDAFHIMTRIEAELAGYLGLDAGTEIVILRNANVISELASVEEITINTGVGPDLITVIGDFTGTSLNLNTITINGGDGDNTIDISGLTSEHRIVFNSGGGNNQVIGALRPQDVINIEGSATINQMPPAPAAVPVSPTVTDPTAPGSSVVSTAGMPALNGTAEDNVIVGTDADTLIIADAGNDIVTTGNADTIVYGGDGMDVIESGDGADTVFGGEADDVIITGLGDDKAWGDGGNDVMDMGDGADLAFGGLGDDDIDGGAGNDKLWGNEGNDKLSGGDGDDRLEGGLGADVQFGGAGNDTFIFRTAAEVDGDTIADFAPGDHIDLHFLDANDATAANETFSLTAATGFTAAGELIIHFDADTEQTVVEGNTDADLGTAEFAIRIDGDHVTELQQQGTIIL